MAELGCRQGQPAVEGHHQTSLYGRGSLNGLGDRRHHQGACIGHQTQEVVRWKVFLPCRKPRSSAGDWVGTSSMTPASSSVGGLLPRGGWILVWHLLGKPPGEEGNHNGEQRPLRRVELGNDHPQQQADPHQPHR